MPRKNRKKNQEVIAVIESVCGQQEPVIEEVKSQSVLDTLTVSNTKTDEPIKLSSILSPDDFNLFEVKRKLNGQQIKREKYMISYEGCKRLARAVGLRRTGSEVVVAPTLENKMTTYIMITVTDEKGNSTSRLGEASNENTAGISAMYKGAMAEKRGFVKAVIDHVALENFYGEEEFKEESLAEEPVKVLSKADFEALAPQLNMILNAQSKQDLDKVGLELKKISSEISTLQLDYLRKVYEERSKSFTSAF